MVRVLQGKTEESSALDGPAMELSGVEGFAFEGSAL